MAAIGSRALVKTIQQSLNEFPQLKFVQLSSTGYDDIDVSLFQNKNIYLSNAPGVYDETVAEYAVYMMLRYAKRYHRSLKNTTWRPLRNYHYISELKGKTVGIMGVGNIGSRIAQILAGYNMRILGYARTTKTKPIFEKIHHSEDFDLFLSQCDFIINTLPDTTESQGILNASRFSFMKKTVVFINVGRDSVYVKNDLIQFFSNNNNAVCILDIFELIPNIFNKMHRMSNILITPRIAAYSKESDNMLRMLIKDNLTSFLKGDKPNCLLTSF